MSENQTPQGIEREVKTMGGAAIDGAPIAYIIVLASVATVLAFIPFSIVLGSGKGIPLSQSIYPLLGWLLGPWAGALASGMGTLIGVFLAPYTAGVPAIAIWGAAIASFAAGAMGDHPKRKYWYLVLTILFILELAAYAYLAIARNGIPVNTFILGAFVDWSAVILFVLPTRTLFARLIGNSNFVEVAIGIFGGTWMICGLAHLSQVPFTYYLFNWPEPVWNMLIPVIPIENTMRGLSGAVIGTGVISGLRAINLVKPKEAIY
ncbi:hypothetical protein H6F42_11040 [Pseudanabaena sp. FACHB-1998]|uniref:hypothetical protein n=1 Tax=Pseudanabaena sp. FACHB-1998 TaxID=2692858 RepID=UPI0016807C0F|nr:hypothetical protein [Pseudanabaena sp. FACHB-1998]MBD2177447.1 hypothetical protein [Pseudanabaena sp. FACHB-1998]